jgi:hypothetical protein
LELIAQTLLEIETLEADEFVALIEGKKLPKKKVDPPPEQEVIEEESSEQEEWKPPSSLDLPPTPTPA